MVSTVKIIYSYKAQYSVRTLAGESKSQHFKLFCTEADAKFTYLNKPPLSYKDGDLAAERSLSLVLNYTRF
jgi:hypothetical protein